MKSLLRIAGLLSLGLILVGCDGPNSISGLLNVTSALPINIMGGKGKVVALTEGTYNTKIDLRRDTSAVVSIKVDRSTVKFAIPKGLANYYGDINVSAADLGQAFGLKGKITETRENFAENRTESCVWTYRNEYRCDRNGHGSQHCEWVQVPVYGSQLIYEEGYYATKHVNIGLVQGRRSSAQFSGQYRMGRTVTEQQYLGGCRP